MLEHVAAQDDVERSGRTVDPGDVQLDHGMRAVQVRRHCLDAPGTPKHRGKRGLRGEVEDGLGESIEEIGPRGEKDPGETVPGMRQAHRTHDVAHSAGRGP
jgi:hypothetical protein